MISAFAFIVAIMMTMVMISCQVNILDPVIELLDLDCLHPTSMAKLLSFKGFYYVQRTSKIHSKPELCHYFQISPSRDIFALTMENSYKTAFPLNNNSAITSNVEKTKKKSRTESVSVRLVKIVANNSDGIILITCHTPGKVNEKYNSLNIQIPKVIVCTNEQHVNSSVIDDLMYLAGFNSTLVSNTQINCPQEDQLT